MSYILKSLSKHALKALEPVDRSWQEGLRFYCQTSDPSDPNLNFMARMWSYALSKGELTGAARESALNYMSTRHVESKMAYDFFPENYPEEK